MMVMRAWEIGENLTLVIVISVIAGSCATCHYVDQLAGHQTCPGPVTAPYGAVCCAEPPSGQQANTPTPAHEQTTGEDPWTQYRPAR